MNGVDRLGTDVIPPSDSCSTPGCTDPACTRGLVALKMLSGDDLLAQFNMPLDVARALRAELDKSITKLAEMLAS